MTTPTRRSALRASGSIAATCLLLAASGCAPLTQRPAPAVPSAETTRAPFSAAKNANAVDVANAQETLIAYIDALRSRDATEAAALMTSYRRAETRAKGWKADIGWWKSSRVKAVIQPGRYLADERAFAQLYAEHFGHPPYKMVVFNVRYGLGPGGPLADTDFVVTRDSAGSPWLVHEFGGAMRPSPPPSPSPTATP